MDILQICDDNVKCVPLSRLHLVRLRAVCSTDHAGCEDVHNLADVELGYKSF